MILPNTSFVAAIVALLLSELPLLAGQSAEEIKQRAMSGDAVAQLDLAAAYWYGPQDSGGIEGIPKDPKYAFIWGEVYMEAVPDYTRGIAKITTWAEAELSAEQLQEAKAEVERIVRQIKANQKP